MSTNSGSREEFRESTRAPIETAVTLQLDAFSEPHSGYTANVSIGGMFVRVADPQPVGTIVRFEVDLDGAESKIRGVAEVAWIRARSQGPERPAGMGIQFRLIEGDGLERLRAVVERILLDQGEPEMVRQRREPPPPVRTAPSTAAPKPKPASSISRPRKPDSHSKRVLPGPLRLRATTLAALVLFAVLVLLLLRTCG